MKLLQFFIFTTVLSSFLLIASIFSIFPSSSKLLKNRTESKVPPEIIKIIQAQSDQQKKLYTALINRIGPIKAQEALFKSGLPFDGQTHLLNHTVGEYLFNKLGAKGLIYCKDYFLASCYHGFIIAAMGTDNVNQMTSKVMENCSSQGKAVAYQCSHAFGHSFLVLESYVDIPKALRRCDNITGYISDFPLFNCYDGVFMENIWGVHDGSPSPYRWIKNDDPIYPCNDTRIDRKYLLACWANQPARIYQMTNDLEAVAAYCNAIDNKQYQKICYNGLARQIHPLTQGSVNKTQTLCSKMKIMGWIIQCEIDITAAAFSVGDRVLPFSICKQLPESEKQSCYMPLFAMLNKTSTQKSEKFLICEKISETIWKKTCKDMFLSGMFP